MNKIYILGNGAMASAIGKGLSKSGFQICFVLRDINKSKLLGLDIFECIKYDDFDINNKVCILCFKPNNLEEVGLRFKNQKAALIISPLANISVNTLSLHIKSLCYVRIMPNTAAEFNKSCTTYFYNKENEELEALALKIILGFGSAIMCKSEEELALAMAINGCAPAFLALVAESIMNAGVGIGLNNQLSKELTSSLFSSFDALLKEEHPALIKENICSPAGVTIKGVNVLEDNNIRSAFIKAIYKSANKDFNN